MKTIQHNASARDKVLHIETEGGIVNITVGLADDEGRPVTHIEILKSEYADELWELDGAVNNRLVDHSNDPLCRHCGKHLVPQTEDAWARFHAWRHNESESQLGVYCTLESNSTVAEPEAS